MKAELALPGPPPLPTSGAPDAGWAMYAPGPGVCTCLALYENKFRVTCSAGRHGGDTHAEYTRAVE
eukprot:6328895-Prymnesium_polylepis.1